MLLACVSLKGGVGKTTCAIHLAAAAQLAGQRTVLVDFDATRSAAKWRYACKVKALAGLEVVEQPANDDRRLRPETLRACLDHYDVVVCDLPPYAARVTRVVAAEAGFVLSPVQPSALSIQALDGTLELLRAQDAPGWLMLNQAQPHYARAHAEALALLPEGQPLLDTKLHDWRAYRRAIGQGETVLTARPPSAYAAAASEVRALYEEITRRATERRR